MPRNKYLGVIIEKGKLNYFLNLLASLAYYVHTNS
jgi:hypothetical protein